MKLINERSQIRDVAKRWAHQYGAFHPTSLKLHELDPKTATAEDVAAIVGNNGWTAVPACDECGGEFKEVVQLGEPPNYESATALICRSCLEKALSLFSFP